MDRGAWRTAVHKVAKSQIPDTTEATEVTHTQSLSSLFSGVFFKFYLFPKHVCDLGDFSGGPAVKTPHFNCKGHGFDPWSGN